MGIHSKAVQGSIFTFTTVLTVVGLILFFIASIDTGYMMSPHDLAEKTYSEMALTMLTVGEDWSSEAMLYRQSQSASMVVKKQKHLISSEQEPFGNTNFSFWEC